MSTEAIRRPVLSILLHLENGSADSLRSLSSIAETVPAAVEFETLIFDDATSDDTDALLRQLSGDLQTLRATRPVGRSAAVDVLARLASGTALLLMQQGSELYPGQITSMLAALESPALDDAEALTVDGNGDVVATGDIDGACVLVRAESFTGVRDAVDDTAMAIDAAIARHGELIQSVVDSLEPTTVTDLSEADSKATRPADLVICLERAVQEPTPDGYRRLLDGLVHCTKDALLVSGYDAPPPNPSRERPFHEPLSMTLTRADPNLEIYGLGERDGLSVLVALKPPAKRHPRDFTQADVPSHLRQHPLPLRMIAMRRLAQRTIGFYPNHLPRILEYPLVADVIFRLARPGSTVVDIGAGVSPLAPYLQESGFQVDTVDPHDLRRQWPTQPEWNEWGYLDYAARGYARGSFNTTLEQLPAERTYDVACSVSVIEHLPADARRALIAEIARRLHPAGTMVLTVDVSAGADNLHNRSEGVQVEDPALHGTFTGLVQEVRAAGFEIATSDVVRDWGYHNVDIGLVVASRR